MQRRSPMIKPAETDERPRVLYVDDQVGNLTVFRASLRAAADICTAGSGQEALAMMAEAPYPIVISDQRMDGMTGSELLTQIRKRYPSTVRILLTAYSDFNALTEAINEGRIARFVRKPWNREEMFAIIQDAWTLHQQVRQRRAHQ